MMTKGKVFDIRRFSTHDGNGIRTTVFLKGCPLKCAWCQNPEGISGQIQPVYFENKCIQCGTCLKIAKNGGVYLENGKIQLNRTRVDDWPAIIDQCPSGAIEMDSKLISVEELVDELMKDEVFFRKGGGVTLSGGEPLMQGEFAVQVLKSLQEKGVHTAIETALNVSTSIVENVVPYLDLIYADMKIADEGEHRKYTGLSNVLIKQNIEYILTSENKEKAIIRTPLIPYYTATEDNLAKIAEFLSGLYPQVKYELLNYNPLAEAKYHLVEREYCFKENPALYTKGQMLAFGQIVKEHGIKNLIMEI